MPLSAQRVNLYGTHLNARRSDALYNINLYNFAKISLRLGWRSPVKPSESVQNWKEWYSLSINYGICRNFIYLCFDLRLRSWAHTYFYWIFFDDSSISKLGGFFNKSEEHKQMSTRDVISPHCAFWRDVCLYISSGVGCLCCLFRFVGSQGLDIG